MISILIPTYNYVVVDLVKTISEQFKNETLSYEIIVIDDCSTKSNIKMTNSSIKEYSHCTLLENPVNLGRSATRNLLAKTAQYNWLLFLDADVIPVENNYISSYLSMLNKEWDLLCGGITYSKDKPQKEQMLRYIYGVNRESRPAVSRNKDKYIVVSANLLIKKKCFLSINTQLDNFYGDDLVLSQNIKKAEIAIEHIDNPVMHLGLENNSVFIQKSMESIETTVHLEKKQIFENNFRPIQRSYLKLKRYGLLGFLKFFINRLDRQILKNLHSSNPSLFLFDIYRLNHYTKLKNNA